VGLPFLVCLALAAGCSHGGTGKALDPGAVANEPAFARPTSLTREAAVIRAHQIGHVHYNLWIGLDGDDDYEGRVTIRFELKSKAKDASDKLYLDFEDGIVKELKCDGKVLVAANEKDHGHYDGHHIHFHAGELHVGLNRIDVAFTHKHSTNGQGLHRFVDPEDKRVYLYSQFEAFSAHRMFPCFDQPDLKATFELEVEAPKDWEVISTTAERDVTEGEGRKTWTFPPTPLISPYVFSLHAGPYEVFEGDANGIPLRLFARKSLAKYIDPKEWFEITAAGLDFYSTQFGYPYPYGKYDQLIVPEFNAGAMENAGAVTFSERFVFRGRVTADEHRRRADVILHEMAHMWFGDLVTMKWWNGLWLNESFATFMASWALDGIAKNPGELPRSLVDAFKDSWQAFFAGDKQWAYWEDQLVTNHPIDVPVPDTDAAGTNFDGITYGKGAASLKQLSYYLGEDQFQDGIQRYFENFALRNTNLHEFMRMLGEASDKDLAHWQQSWLQTKGVNGVRAEWACAPNDDHGGANEITRMKLVQSPPEGGTELRPHRTQVGLYYFSEAGKERHPAMPTRKTKRGQRTAKKAAAKETPPQRLEVTYDGAETAVTEAVGHPCPDLVFPNAGDYDFARVELDPKSLDSLHRHLSALEDPFLRQMLWFTLWSQVVDGKLRPQDYADIALAHAGHEKSTLVLRSILGTLNDVSLSRESVMRFLPADSRGKLRSRLEAFLMKGLDTAEPGSDLQLVWLEAYLGAARSDDALDFVGKLLAGKRHLRGFKLDADRRWSLVTALARMGAPDARELIAAELKTDPSDTGARRAIAAEASIPDAASKRQWLSRILREKDSGEPLPVARLREAMRNYNLIGQESLTRPAIDAYFEALPKLALLTDEEYAHGFASAMFPEICDEDIVRRTSAILAAHVDLPASVLKSLKVGRQEEERCLRARRLAAGILEPAPTPSPSPAR
jgi:aminopeptidase N